MWNLIAGSLYKQCAFQKFCNTVLHNEACDTHRELRRHKAKEDDLFRHDLRRSAAASYL